MPKKILVIEDERDIADLIRLHLEDLGFDVSLARDGNTGLMRSASAAWDLIILDLRLPGFDGLEICRRIRQESHATPVMMVTSKSSELDRVVGLEVGADDYVTKPFSILELVARVKAILRRSELRQHAPPEEPETVEIGCIFIDPGRRCVDVRGERVELTAREFDLLLHFARNPGRVFRRTELLDCIWGYGHDGYEHTVNSHINRLRAKIEIDPRHPELVVTVRGVGYKLNEKCFHRLTA
ncbi:MAG: response regulator transcription factor [Gammaproteobacteria bacterium]